MTKQYYIVSEGELDAALFEAYEAGNANVDMYEETCPSHAACRARPINTSDEYYIVSKELLRRLETLAFDYGYLSGSEGPYHKKQDAKYEVDQTLKDCFGISYCFEEG